MSDPFPTLSTPRLALKQFMPEDVSLVFKGLSHPEVIPYYGVSYKTLEETQAQMRWYKELEETGKGIWWAIWSTGGTTFYGAAGFNNTSKEHRKAELGFWLLPEYWGNGFISEALTAVLAYAYQDLKLHRIEALVETENNNSSKALLKQRFKLEGTMRDCELKGDRYISLDLFARLATE